MQGRKIKTKLIVTAFLFLTGCTWCTQPAHYPTASDEIHQSMQTAMANNKALSNKNASRVPRSVSNALIPQVDSSSSFNTANAEHRFNISADKIPARTFFMGLVEGTSTNMIVNPNVTGDVTLHLKNVTVEEAMDAVRDMYGYEYKKTPYGYEVLAEELQSQMFNVNYLDIKRTGKSFTRLSTGQISEQLGVMGTGVVGNAVINQPVGAGGNNPNMQPSGSSVKTESEFNFWKSLNEELTTMIGTSKGHTVVVNPQAGIIIVRAYPSELHRVARFLDRMQSNMDRQVILEAKVLEVQLDNQFQAGIDWNLFGKGNGPFINPLTGAVVSGNGGVSQRNFNTFDRTDLRDFQNIFTLNIKGDFGVLIKMLQTQGNVQVLSSPRLSTVNNQKAVIKVGQDEFFVTGVSTNNFVTANATVPTQDVSLTPFFSGVTLDVTPQISNNGEIVLHIHPSVSTVKNQEKEIQLGTVSNPSGSGTSPNTLTLPLALSTIRESDNIVHARNGQIVVIGGLMQNTTMEQVAGVPVLSKLPFIGAMFRRTFQTSVKSELVILLRPIIANTRSFDADMQKSDQRIVRMDRGYHVGGFPEIFGTQAEREPFDVSTAF
jgi:MSHA biogenesis protein MshL